MCSLAKGERAYLSCPASRARLKDSAALLPDPPDGVDRVEYEVELLSMIQVCDDINLLYCESALQCLCWCTCHMSSGTLILGAV